MPAWQGSVADTILYLIRHEGKNPEQAAAIAHSLAEDEGASKPVMVALETRVGVKALDDASMMSAHKRLHTWALSSNGDAQVFKRETTEAHSWLVAEMVARGVEHKLYDGLDKAAHRAEQNAAKAATHNDTDNPSVMVAWMVPSEIGNAIAMKGGEPVDDLHATLAYLGRRKDLSDEQLADAQEAVREVVADALALRGEVAGLGRFAASESSDGMDVIYGAVDVPGFVELRQSIAAALEKAGVPPKRDHDWTPHVSLAYIEPDAPTPRMKKALRGSPITVTALTFAEGQNRTELALAPALATEKGHWIVKRETEQRYTLSVAYPVDQLDKHGEFMTADDLEAAAWRYMAGSRRVGIMHEGRGDKGTGGAGEIVESYIYRGPDWHIAGEIVRAGDWLVGIIWDESAWQSIKAGNYTGLSFQGLVSSSSAVPPKHAPPA